MDNQTKTPNRQQMIDDFNAFFSSNADPFDVITVGDAVVLSQSKTEPEELYHCNLRKSEWAYHTKLTNVAEEFFQRGMKQKETDREM